MARVALVVSGGSSKGAFAVGVAQRLREKLDVHFDIVAGTSTGSLVAPLVVTGEFGVLEQLYTAFSARNLIMLRQPLDMVRTGSVFDMSALRTVLEDTYTEGRTQQILASPMQMFITTVQLESGRTTYFHSGPEPTRDPDCDYVRIARRKDLIDAVFASSMQPVLMLPVRIGGASYVDGGVRKTVAMGVAIDNGATDVYAVVLSAENEAADAGPFDGLVPILKRTIDLFGDEIVLAETRRAQFHVDTINYVAAVQRRLQGAVPDGAAGVTAAFHPAGSSSPLAGTPVAHVYLIRPTDKLLADSLKFSLDDMRRMVRLGRERVDAMWPGIQPQGALPVV